MKMLIKRLLFLTLFVCFMGCSDDDNADVINAPVASFCQTGRNDLLFTCFRTDLFDIKSSITQNSIFPNTELLQIPPYSYPAPPNPSSSLGTVIEISGDESIQPLLDNNNCCDITEILDRFPANPSFQWNSITSQLVAVAIFQTQVEISTNGNRIKNIEDIVWTWNSGMGGDTQSGGKTTVEFSSGRDVQEGEILDTITELNENQVYVWAVWAWNENGTAVSFSSRAIPFVVENLPSIALTEPEQLTATNGIWTIVSATDINTNINVTQDFPIQIFTVDLNCDDTTGNDNPIFSTFPNNLMGTIDTIENKITFGTIDFSNLFFPCDERLITRANYDNELLEVIYENR